MNRLLTLVAALLLGACNAAPEFEEESSLTSIEQTLPCTVSATCPDGNTLSCSGLSSCSAGLDSVTCDGTTTYCFAPTTCMAKVRCLNGSIISCTGINECYSQPRCAVICDGAITQCPPPGPGEPSACIQ